MIQAIKYSIKFYRCRGGTLTLLGLLHVLRIAANLIAPLVYASIINNLVEKAMVEIAVRMLALVLIYAASAALSQLIKRIEIKLVREVNLAVKSKVSDQLLSIPPQMLGEYSSGKMQVLLSTDTLVPSSIISTVLSTLVSVLSIVGTAGTVFAINYKLAAILICTYPISIVINNRYSKRLKASSQLLSKDNDSFIGFIRQVSGNVSEIKAQNGKRAIIKKYDEFACRNRDLTLKHMYITADNALCIRAISLVNYAVLTCFGIIFVVKGTLTLGSLVAFNTYSKTLSSALDSVVQLKASLQPSLVSIDRLMEVDDIYLKHTEKENADKEIVGRIKTISYVDVSISFKGQNVLENFTYEFREGITGIMGPNGCGKTTIMNLMLKNCDHDAGHIFLNEYENSSVRYSEIQKKLSYVGPGKTLFDLSLKDNLLLFAETEGFDMAEVPEILEVVHLHEDIAALPDGLDTQIDENFKLSAGQTQKLQIARTLLKKPDVMLFDEAFSNLDASTKASVLQYIKKNCSEKIVVIVSHVAEDYAICDRIIELSSVGEKAFLPATTGCPM